MAFSNTKTPTKPTIKAKWQVPQRPHPKAGVMEYYLEGELKDRFCKLFPKNSNRRMMEWFGISFSTLQRFKRELRLEKDMHSIRKQLAKDVKTICEKNGYYDSLRGKAPSPQCIEATKRLRASGFHPMKQLKKNNPRRYKRVIKQRSEQRLALERHEQRLLDMGLSRQTRLHRPLTKYYKAQLGYRYRMSKLGYILGDMSDSSGERYVIYYDKDTERSRVVERGAQHVGFSIKLLA